MNDQEEFQNPMDEIWKKFEIYQKTGYVREHLFAIYLEKNDPDFYGWCADVRRYRRDKTYSPKYYFNREDVDNLDMIIYNKIGELSANNKIPPIDEIHRTIRELSGMSFTDCNQSLFKIQENLQSR